MEKQGRRFSDTKEIKKDDTTPVAENIGFPTDEEAPEKEKGKKNKKEKKTKEQRLKEKNAKKLEKLMKKERKNKKAAADDELAEDEERFAEEEQFVEESDPELERSDDRKRKRRSPAVKKRIIAALILVVAVFAVVFFVANGDKLSCHNISNFISYGILNRNSDERFPINIQGQSINAGNFLRNGQDVSCTSDTKTMLINNYGKTEYSIQHQFLNPVLASSDNKVLVYNLGGTGYQIIEKQGQVYSADSDENITCAAINNKGVYALVTQSSGYLSKLTVNNSDHNQIYAYFFADYYVTSVSLSDSGKQAVVTGVSAVNGVTSAAIYVLDFTKDKPLYFSEFEGDIIYGVKYLSDRYAAAVGSASTYSVNTSNGEIHSYQYEGRTLTAFDINTDTDTYTVSLSESGDGRNCEIVSFNSSGGVDRSFNISDKIIDLSTYKGRVALLTNESVMLYGKDGTHYSDKGLTSDPHAVVMYTTSDIYVLCTGYIDSVTL